MQKLFHSFKYSLKPAFLGYPITPSTLKTTQSHKLFMLSPLDLRNTYSDLKEQEIRQLEEITRTE
jgi:hypothetical protein